MKNFTLKNEAFNKRLKVKYYSDAINKPNIANCRMPNVDSFNKYINMGFKILGIEMHIIDSSTPGLLKAFLVRLKESERFKQKSISTKLKIIIAFNIYIQYRISKG